MQFKLDGHKVYLSTLTQRPHRAAPCELLLCVTRSNQKAALSAFKKTGEFGRYSGLHVSGIADLSFLADFPSLLYLEVADQPRVNTECLAGLANLRGLRLESPGTGIDFAWFPELEVFSGDWHAEHRNLAQCQELRRLQIWQFKPESEDLAELANLTRLEDLDLIQTNIASLEGLQTLEDLRYLDIAYAAKLESLEALSWQGCGIRELSLMNAKKIASYQPIVSVELLRRLKLSRCAAMPDLHWTTGMQHLDFFSFVETDVLDGDLSPLLRLPRLRYVGTMDKKRYNYKSEALNQLLAARR